LKALSGRERGAADGNRAKWKNLRVSLIAFYRAYGLKRQYLGSFNLGYPMSSNPL
jgi:hypothetical protein